MVIRGLEVSLCDKTPLVGATSQQLDIAASTGRGWTWVSMPHDRIGLRDSLQPMSILRSSVLSARFNNRGGAEQLWTHQ